MPHCSTHDMLADPLTKPLTPGIAIPHIKRMAGIFQDTEEHYSTHMAMEEEEDALDETNEQHIVSQIQVYMMLNLHLHVEDDDEV